MSEGAFTRQRPRDFDGTTAAELAVFEATEELLSETTLQELTVAQILERGGLSRANFYHYFANKHQVLVAMTSRLFDQVYGQDAPWDSSPGRGRARTMGASLEHTLRLWSVHGPVICAVVEHMHGEPAVARAWQPTYRRFQAAVSEQIEHERVAGRASVGPPADMVAAMLICGVERALYVGSRGLDPRLPTVGDAVESLVALNEIAIYGGRPAPPVALVDRREVNNQVGPSVPERKARSETAQSILDAMRELLLTHPLGDLSVAKIIDCASVSRASFYFYFRNRDDAFAALFQEAAERMVASMSEIAHAERGDPEQVASALQGWLNLDEMTTSVIRNAVHEWPRRAELRVHYLAAIGHLADQLESIIEVDRECGLAPPGPPAPQFAATLLWMVERTVAGSLAGEAHLEDFASVKTMLAGLLSTAIYGRR
ncbi:TetR/AcrR family transcriptional regulator [Williamsia soli]|uniref:TetR/AcrR family transcriptional regulator n=1 Tax=Williamsia soli TaxID=364929 RepID=UPI001A9E1126|nr:TetR/AcrR family transcriptional regulator [Williamsia soli]